MWRGAAVSGTNCAPEGARSKAAPEARATRLALAAAFIVVAATALAGPRSIDDCEAIKEADAYNLCLASFGPTRAQKVKSYPGVASGGGPHAARASGGVAPRRFPRFGGHAHVTQGRGGRVRMEFTPRR